MENHEKRPLPEARTYTVEDIAAMLNIGAHQPIPW